MKVAILGTRGIPNNYGGFEQFAEYLALGLVSKGHDVTVYSSKLHPYQKDSWKGINIVHIYDPENYMGTSGQFVYDFFSILDSRKKNYDIIFQLGYTSSSLFYSLHPLCSVVVTNMDGLEWKRTKYSKKVQWFLKWAESLAVEKSNFLVADSMGIKNYLKNKYGVESCYIPYGADLFSNPDVHVLKEYGLDAYGYNMLIARMEPENSIEVVLDGFVDSERNMPFLVVGNCNTKYGRYLRDKYINHTYIRFVGAIYRIEILNNLRYFSNIYFHGHTVGGTNPSLLEAMASSALVCANDNDFNSSILGRNAFYFINKQDVSNIINTIDKNDNQEKIVSNLTAVKNKYSWDIIIDVYEKNFLRLLGAGN